MAAIIASSIRGPGRAWVVPKGIRDGRPNARRPLANSPGWQALPADSRDLRARRYRRGPHAHALKPASRQDRDIHRMK